MGHETSFNKNRPSSIVASSPFGSWNQTPAPARIIIYPFDFANWFEKLMLKTHVWKEAMAWHAVCLRGLACWRPAYHCTVFSYVDGYCRRSSPYHRFTHNLYTTDICPSRATQSGFLCLDCVPSDGGIFNTCTAPRYAHRRLEQEP